MALSFALWGLQRPLALLARRSPRRHLRLRRRALAAQWQRFLALEWLLLVRELDHSIWPLADVRRRAGLWRRVIEALADWNASDRTRGVVGVLPAASSGRTGPGSKLRWRAMLERAVLFAVVDNTLRAYGLESDQRVGSVLNAEAWRPTRRCQAAGRVQLLCFGCSA